MGTFARDGEAGRETQVLQYRTWCRELEQQLEAGGGSLPGRREATEDHSLKKALLQLEEEQQRCENLAEVNTLLREQLGKANEVNSALKEDVGKLTADWMRAREELELTESEWRGERELYDSCLRGEQSRLLSLWRQVVTFRRHFLEMKTATDRDLSELKAEQLRLSGSILVSCSHLNSGVRLWESVSLGRPVLKDEAQQEAEEEMSQKTWEAMHLQVKGDLEKKELQERLKDLAALEEKHALLQSELVDARETLEESHLQRDLLKQEKHQLTMALEKAEQAVAELTGAQNKLSAEAADLRVATAKMSSMNEALALDKVQLSKLVLQLEQENEALSGKVGEVERAKISEQEKLTLCERTNEELSAEKAHLEQLLKKAEEHQEGLQVELRRLAEEKAETQEKLSQVYRQQESASSGLEQLRQESSRQGHALAKVCKEKELLVHEKAALEVRLAAVERDRQGLSEQLAEARSAKETLESSLFEAQQRLSQLEIARSQLEVQLHTVTQAKEVIQGEVKCLQCELEAERTLMRQERENMAERLLQTERQYDNTLRLRQAEHEVEISKLLQDLASEREGHHSEVQEMLEQWEKEKAETEREHEKKLFDVKQEVATVQNITEELQAELQETQSKTEAVEKRHKEEIQTVKEEMNILLQQRDALQNQVEELTSQLAASEEPLKKEAVTLHQEVASLERRLESTEKQRKDVLQERDRLQALKEELVWEIKLLQESVTASETRATTATDRHHSLEQELHTTVSLLKIKNEELEMQREKIQVLQKEAAQGKALQENLTHVTAILSEREGEMKVYQEQMRLLEEQKEMHKTALDQVIKDVREKNQKIESQQEEIQELEKQQEEQRIAVSKMSKDLEERDQEIRSLKTLQNLQLRLTKKNEEVRHHREQEKLLEAALHEREQETKAQGEQEELDEERRALREDLRHVQQTLTKRDEEIKYQRDRVGYLEKTLAGREQELRRQSELLKQITSALRWKDGGETLQKQIQKLRKWEEEEAEKRRVLQERDRLLQRQKELTQQLEDERKAKGEELERAIAILKQTESGEMEWKEKAQALTLALTKSEMANGTLREEVAVLQSMVSERDTDRFHHQQATAEGEQLSWLSEKRLLSQRLEHLQRAVARLEVEKTELKQLNAELRRTLEQVERERRRLKRYCSGRSLPDACGFSLSDQHKVPASRQEESHTRCSRRLAELQNQVSLLQTQLAQERKCKQDYIECCAKTSQELSDLHRELSCSLAAVVREPEAAVLEAETRKLAQPL
ncbi:centrosome-associated protein CEP250-like isoform X4 [Gymnogyps californianus]|uniref:centrosome-associated protein CEP250-like isoform X4 n=1 Tax=Gymnogyps californianus TaxID=33616 RepID=UPI0021CA788E|nr:centrosome-associated protein CEP250-like isoform X4 [Gymnogyps californianus]XP_050770539.1 centrosome-associated protein CEP250-like isoform X4 [Gymnogyps californianus]XP_050770540.1 centrosome-associated protein CEP250-like isoform X4 [Gymnogyps californianus]XP_050770541.1 centrosome-associated protein CEP250-like isoform X4 [Gymnogyps californianus]XP_050770542.1 centrosome-associated protein CEP250-like isoform X4 [Gymnogyps californianus]